METPPDLEKHVRRVQAGELDAYAEVVRLCERPIRAWVVMRCPPGGDADEVAQKAFVEAFKRIDEYEPGTDFRAWLFTIARYQLMAECTRLKRIADYHSRYAPYALSQALSQRLAEQHAESSSQLDHLKSCLKTLDARGRELLDWRYREELPLQEMADGTGRSVGAIKKHLHGLRQKLYQCITRKQNSEVSA